MDLPKAEELPHGLAENIVQVPELLVQGSNIVAGVSIVENAYREP